MAKASRTRVVAEARRPQVIRIGGRDFAPPPATSCGSCIPCVTKSGAPCVLGHRQIGLRYAPTPAMAGARVLAGDNLPAAHTPGQVFDDVKHRPPAEMRDVWRDAAPTPFEPCRASWCSEIDLHPKHGSRRRRAS